MPYWWAYTPYILVYLILFGLCFLLKSSRFLQWILFALFALGMSYETFANRRNYIPNYIQENFVNLIEDVKEVKLGPFFRTFNPGVVPYNDGYLMIARCGKKASLILALLNKDFTLLGKSHLLTSLCIAPEDPRLFIHGEKIYVCYNDCPKECREIKNPPRAMYLAEVTFAKGEWGLTNILRLSFNRPEELERGFTKNVEKNWSPFIYQEEIHFIYAYDPLIVVKPNLETGICEEVSHADELQFTKPYKEPRGGTPAYPTENGYLAFYHICNTDVPVKRLFGFYSYGIGAYLIGAVEISKDPPFRILKKTNSLISGHALYTKKRKIEYPSALVVENDRLIFFWGREDKKIMVGTINRQKLQECMVSP